MNIDTKRLIIRNFQPNDVNDLYEILGDGETMKYCEPAYSFEQTEKFLKSFCMDKCGAAAAVQRETSKVIGYILFKELEQAVYEIGWFFNRKYWGKGYAFEACSEVIRYAFNDLDAHKIIAETIDKTKSVNLMKKLGMLQEGIQRSHTRDCLGNWTDLYLYGILKEDWINAKINNKK